MSKICLILYFVNERTGNMKKNLPIIALCTAMALAGCTDSTLKSIHSHEFRKSFALAEGRTDSLTVEMNVECPEDGLTGKVTEKIGNQIKRAIYGDNFTVLHVDDGFTKFSEDLAKEYRAANLDLLEKFKDMAGLSWEYILESRFTGTYRHYASYRVSTYSYTGGAHGMPATKAYVFDLKSGESVEESEFFTEDYMPQLSELLTAHAKDGSDNPDKLTLFVSEVEPNGNFEVSAEGITYIYNPYDIAPYSDGTIFITIPWKELKTILK